MRRHHLLYLAFFFPPSRSSGVYRALGTVKAFHDAGWKVTVVTTTHRFFKEEIGSTDDSLLELIPDGVGVVRVPFTFRSELPKDLREMGWFRGNFPLLWVGLRKRLRRVIAALDVIRGRSPDSYRMDDRYLSWIEPVVSSAKDIARESPFDHVLATGNPYSAFEAARVIGALQDVPFSIDYRDPWAFDMRGVAPLSPATFAAEERIIAEAHGCIHVNEANAQAYRERYRVGADKQWVVINGYDDDSIPPLRGDYDGGPIHFGMLGTVTDLWPLPAVFEAWHRVRPQLPERSTLRLGGHLGFFQWSEDNILSSLPDEESAFIYEGPIPKAKVADYYSRLHVVVTPLWGGPRATAGKIPEVAVLGVPIVCIQNENGGGRSFLRDHPLTFGVDADADQIVGAMLAAADLAKTITRRKRESVREEWRHYERQTEMQQLVKVVSSASREGATV